MKTKEKENNVCMTFMEQKLSKGTVVCPACTRVKQKLKELGGGRGGGEDECEPGGGGSFSRLNKFKYRIICIIL
jgi:hypothetical protein